MIWGCLHFSHSALIKSLGSVAERCFKKVPNVGPRSPKIGNACLYVLSSAGTQEAVVQLILVRGKVKHASTIKHVNKAIARAARKAGLTTAELEELAVPDFGLQAVGRAEVPFGDYKARLIVSGAQSTELIWFRPDGKKQKSIPKCVKNTYQEKLKHLKTSVKEIKNILSSQRSRIERFLLSGSNWSFADWRQRYLNHPLRGVLARSLIWEFTTADKHQLGIWHSDQIVDHHGTSLPDLDSRTKVTLWHPIHSSPETVHSWRIWLENNQVTQPFKQAHREIYSVTPAELCTAIYSTRFAAHILKQHQFAALCRERGWAYTLQGTFDSQNTPTMYLRDFGFKVELYDTP